MASASGEDLAEAVRKYHLPDFSHWKNHAAFEAAFAPPAFHFRLHLISARRVGATGRLEKDLRTSLR